MTLNHVGIEPQELTVAKWGSAMCMMELPVQMGLGKMILGGHLAPPVQKRQVHKVRKITDSHSWLGTLGAKNPMWLNTQKGPAQ